MAAPVRPPLRQRKSGNVRSIAHRAAAPTNSETPAEPATTAVDSSYLESLVGYNTRRASLVITELFGERMAGYDLRPVDFSILSLITHNPGITSRQLCTHLGILPPNLVAMVATMVKRDLIVRQPHARDGRAMSLYLTADGQSLMAQAEQTAAALELQATARLDTAERNQLIGLLQKIYR